MSTPLYQEALIEARKLREAAAAEAKNAVLEAVSPLIKQMIDKEISGIIVEEQEEPATAAGDVPPPPPPPSPDAGATTPVDAAPPAGIEAAPASSMPGMTPAVAAASPPIAPVGTPVMGKIDVGPTGEQRIVIDVDSLFAKETTPAETSAAAVPTEPAAEEVPPPPPPEVAPAGVETAPGAPPAPESLAEIYRAVQRLLREEAAPPAPTTDPNAPPAAPAVPPAPPAGDQATGTVMPIDQMAGMMPTPTPPGMPPAAPAVPPAAPAVPPAVPPAAPAVPPAVPPAAPAVPPAAPAVPPAAPPAAPPAPLADPNAPPAAPPPVTPAPTGAAPVMEYKVYKQRLDQIEQGIGSLRNSKMNPSFVKEGYEKQLFGLYQNLIDLKSKNAISSRLFSFNEDRLGLLYENLNVITSYNRNPITKGKNMANKNSLKDLVHALFEGAEGFEEPAGKVSLPADSDGGSAEHAHKISGNPKGVKAEAESAPFRTKEKSEWPGKPSPESLLEQLEEEIG